MPPKQERIDLGWRAQVSPVGPCRLLQLITFPGKNRLKYAVFCAHTRCKPGFSNWFGGWKNVFELDSISADVRGVAATNAILQISNLLSRQYPKSVVALQEAEGIHNFDLPKEYKCRTKPAHRIYNSPFDPRFVFSDPD